MTIEVVSFPYKNNEEKTKEHWNELYAIGAHSFFLSWDWIGTWLASLPPSLDPLIYCGTKNGEIVSAIVIIKRKRKVFGLPLLAYGYSNSSGDPYYDKIAIEYNQCVGSLAMEEQLQFYSKILEKAGIDRLSIPCGKSLDLSALNDIAGKKYSSVIDSSGYQVDLEKVRSSLTGYLGLLSRNKRYQLKRSLKCVASSEPLLIKEAVDLSEKIDFYEQLAKFHNISWERRGLEGAFSNSFLYEMHENLLKSKQVKLFQISAKEKVLGYIHGFEEWSRKGRRFLYYQSGFSDFTGDNKYKPGLSCHYALISYLAERDWAEYDFLAGDYDYKRSLATDSNTFMWITLSKKTLLNSLILSILRLRRAFLK